MFQYQIQDDSLSCASPELCTSPFSDDALSHHASVSSTPATLFDVRLDMMNPAFSPSPISMQSDFECLDSTDLNPPSYHVAVGADLVQPVSQAEL